MDPDRVNYLLDRHFDAAASAAEKAELERLLVEDAAVAALFWQRADFQFVLCKAIDTAHDERRQFGSLVPRLRTNDSATENSVIARQANDVKRGDRRDKARQGLTPQGKTAATGLRGLIHDFAEEPLALAILVLVMIFGGIAYWQLSSLSPQPVAKQPPAAPHLAGEGVQPEFRTSKSEVRNRVVARLTRSVDASWSQSDAPADGAEIKAHQKLVLTQGLAEIAFDSGAKVILEGPAEFEVGGRKTEVGTPISPTSDNACSLTRGKLVAQVPQSAHGFTVHTPMMNVVDLGTEFGVWVKSEVGGRRSDRLPLAPTSDVRPPTSTEVHVIQGEVSITGTEVAQAATPLSDGPPTSELRPPILLKAGETASSKSGGNVERVVPVVPTKFVRQLPPEGIAAASKPGDAGGKPMLQPGDILAVTRNTLKLVKIDSKSGEQTVLVQGDSNRHGAEWMCVAVDARGEVWVGSGLKGNEGGQVLRIHPRDGTIRVLASGGLLSGRRVNGLTVAADGMLYATLDGSMDKVIRVDPQSGAVAEEITWGDNIWGIAADTDGRGLIAVSDYPGKIARIEKQTVSLWTENAGAVGAAGVAVRPDGRVFVSVTSEAERQCKIVEVDRAAHRVTEIVRLPMQYQWKLGMLAVEPAGRLIVGNGAPTSKVYRVDVDARTIVPVAEGKELERVWGVAVVPGGPAEKKTNAESGN